MQAIRIIGNEHRSLAAVLHGMVYLVHDIRDHDTKPNFPVLGAMVYYADTVPERFHHPKEDKYLFAVLRSRCPAAHPVLDRLEQEHRTGAEKIRTLEQSLSRYQAGGRSEFAAFLAIVDDYVAFEWDHMRLEEAEALPLAKEHLTAADWESIDAAFAGHTDPLLGAEAGAKYDKLFTRIVNLAPAPIGLG